MNPRAASISLAIIFPLAILAGLEASAAQSPVGPVSTRAHYLIFTMDKNENVTLLSDQEVTMAGPLLGEAEDETRKPKGHHKKAVIGRVFDVSGKQLFRKTVDVSQVLRVERQHGWGEMEGREVELEEMTFVVRVPVLKDEAEIELEVEKSGKKKRFGLKKPKKNGSAYTITTSAFPFTPETQDVNEWLNPANRVNLLILGDGYTSAQHSIFDADVSTFTSGFFGIAPYLQYRNYVEVRSVFAASAQAGADHPPCTDPDEVSDPLEPSYVNTVFDARYCNNNIQRALVVDYTKVFNFAASYPDWDQIMVIVNDDLYGGTGGGVSVFAAEGSMVATAQHEHGHSFTGLADEYDYAGGSGTCSDASGSGSPCEANVTNLSTLSQIKWNPWIPSGTPIPTPETSSYDNVVGLFEGARYQTTGMYRPHNWCMMRSLDYGFCEVCRQEYVKVLYGWVDQIEWPSPSSANVYSAPNTSKTYSASVLNPSSGPAQVIEWRVNGVLQSGQTSSSFTYTPTANGTYSIQMKAKDPTTFVHSSMAGGALEDTHTWTLTVSQPAPPSDFRATAQTEFAVYVAVEWTPVPNATEYRLEKSTDNVNWTFLATVGGAYGYHSFSASLGQAYLVRIATIDQNGVQGTWGTDLATVFSMTDQTLSGTSIKATHINEVRGGINAARTQLTTLGNASYSSAPAVGQPIARAHVTETRNAIAQLRSALNLPAFAFTDPDLTVGMTAKDEHTQDLRTAIR